MPKSKTKNDFVDYLNEIGSTMDDCIYMTNKKKTGKSISFLGLQTALYQGRYGNVLKKYDPIAFQLGYNEWKLQYV